MPDWKLTFAIALLGYIVALFLWERAWRREQTQVARVKRVLGQARSK